MTPAQGKPRYLLGGIRRPRPAWEPGGNHACVKATRLSEAQATRQWAANFINKRETNE